MDSVRVDQLEGPNAYAVQIVERIAEAALVLADVTYAHPNVFYNLGIAHSLAKRVLILAKKGTEIPFDIKDFHLLFYDASGLRELKEILRDAIG